MEKLFLLEVLVENVEIDYTKLDVDKKVLDAAKQLCIKIQFLSFPELTICEEDFCASLIGDYQKNNINIKSGKSCLFSIRHWNIEDRSMPLNVTVLRTRPEPPHITVGRACINLGSSFTNILAAAQSTEYTETITKKCTDVYILTNNSGTDVGKIRMFVRLTCFGPLIVTQFQISGDENNSFLFRGNDGSGIVTFNRNNSGELFEKPAAPIHVPTKQVPCGEFQKTKYPQDNRPADCPPCPPCLPCLQEWNNPNVVPGQGMMPQSGQGTILPRGQGMMPSSGQGMIPQSGQGTIPPSGQGMMPSSGQGTIPPSGQGMMPSSGQGMIPQSGQGTIPPSGQGMMPSSGQGMMPGMGQGMMPGTGQGMMPGSGHGTMPWGDHMMPPGGQTTMPLIMGSGMNPWGDTVMMQGSEAPVTIMTAGGQGMVPESGFMMMPGGGQGMMPGEGQGMMTGWGQGMMPGGGQGMMTGWGQGMMPGGGQGMIPQSGQGMMPGAGEGMVPGGGQGMVPGGGPGMMPGGGPGMIPAGGQGMMPGVGQMMPGGGQMIPGSGQGVMAPGGEQNDLDYKEFGAEVNGHSLSIKVLRKTRTPKKVTPPPPICGHIPIGKKSSSSSSSEEIPPSQPPIQFCECDFPLPPGFSRNGYMQGSTPMKKKKKKKSKDNNLKCPLEYSGCDPFVLNYMGQALKKTRMEATDNMKNTLPVNKYIGMLADSPTNQKGPGKTPEEQVHTSGNPTFILNIPPKVFPVQDQQLETPFLSEQAKLKPKKLTESGTQYYDKDGMAPEKLPIDGKDKGEDKKLKNKKGKKSKKDKKK